MLAWMKELLDKFLDLVLKVLPVSPFAPYIAAMDRLPFLGYLNWFIPVGTLLKIGSAWLAAIAIFYLYMVVARWIKLVS